MSPDISRGVELRGWKQIAHYLNVSERTAKGWETCLNLPVHRLPGDRGRLFATTVELETWKRECSRPAPATPVRKPITVRFPKHLTSEQDSSSLPEISGRSHGHQFASLCRT
jgi:hypothetical protein